MDAPAHVVLFSSGVTSYVAARRVVDAHGPDAVTLLFADTLIEDEDNYRFLRETVADLGARLVTLADGRTPWEVFRDERFIGNARVDPCSKILKRGLIDKWRDGHCDPATTTLHVGLSWEEPKRLARLQERAAPWRYEAPLMERPYLTKAMCLDFCRARGIEPPRLYALGFSHANCGGFCVKAGHGGMARLLRAFPERYAEHERAEAELMAELDTPWGILNDRTGGTRTPLTLRDLRERVEAGQSVDLFDEPCAETSCACALS